MLAAGPDGHEKEQRIVVEMLGAAHERIRGADAAVQRDVVNGAPGRRTARRRALLAACLLLVGLGAVGAAELLRLQRGVDEARSYWSQPRGETGGLVLAVLGDSTAQGVGASSPERGWPGLVADRLRMTTRCPVVVHNLSRSGARVADVLRTQVPRLAGLDADLVLVAVGGNDVRRYDGVRFAADARRLAVELPPGALVADAPYFMHGHWQRDAEQAAALLRAAVRAHEGVVVPLHAHLRRRGWRAMLTDFAADWFHPNDRGHRVWAEAFWGPVQDSDAVRTCTTPPGPTSLPATAAQPAPSE